MISVLYASQGSIASITKNGIDNGAKDIAITALECKNIFTKTFLITIIEAINQSTEQLDKRIINKIINCNDRNINITLYELKKESKFWRDIAIRMNNSIYQLIYMLSLSILGGLLTIGLCILLGNIIDSPQIFIDYHGVVKNILITSYNIPMGNIVYYIPLMTILYYIITWVTIIELDRKITRFILSDRSVSDVSEDHPAITVPTNDLVKNLNQFVTRVTPVKTWNIIFPRNDKFIHVPDFTLGSPGRYLINIRCQVKKSFSGRFIIREYLSDNNNNIIGGEPIKVVNSTDRSIYTFGSFDYDDKYNTIDDFIPIHTNINTKFAIYLINRDGDDTLEFFGFEVVIIYLGL